MKAATITLLSLVHLVLVAGVVGCVGNEPPSEGYGPGHNQGKDCLACHTQGGEAEEHIWTMAGTVFSDAQGSAPAEDVQVLVYDNAGTLKQTLVTDYNGNFWTSDPVPSQYRIGLTQGQDTVWMATQPTNPSCASCHTQGNFVHYP
jgi:nitrate/TMAO reductase-like tetraheme cytochrome c subunit